MGIVLCAKDDKERLIHNAHILIVLFILYVKFSGNIIKRKFNLDVIVSEKIQSLSHYLSDGLLFYYIKYIALFK